LFRFINFLILSKVKLLCSVFYRYEAKFMCDTEKPPWDDVKLIVLLNHTSLFEPVFVKLAPFKFIWRISKDIVVPAADVTMKRPVVGKIMKAMVPGVVPISRKRDNSWKNFLAKITPNSITGIIPEGRMMRKTGLDKDGKPMTVRGGVADILQMIERGKILFVYSGGLHHIQSPGDTLPKVFKKIKANLEFVDVRAYKKKLNAMDVEQFRRNVVDDMQQRLQQLVPH
jgi:hypothetical protein